MKAFVFWLVAPCRVIAIMVEAVSSSETSLGIFQTTRCHNPEDAHLHTCLRENLKYHSIKYSQLIRDTLNFSSILTSSSKRSYNFNFGRLYSCISFLLDKIFSQFNPSSILVTCLAKTDQLLPRSRFHLGLKLIVTELAMKFPVLYRARSFIVRTLIFNQMNPLHP